MEHTHILEAEDISFDQTNPTITQIWYCKDNKTYFMTRFNPKLDGCGGDEE